MGQKGGRDAFVSQGFDTWNKKDAFRTHVGGVDSFHNKAKEKLLLKTGLTFRGHDESVNSENRGLYIEVLKVIRETSEDIFNNTLENAPKNNQLISPKIQKEPVQCFAQEVLLSIREEIGQDVFALLVDESSDVSKNEQMAIVLRYVDSLGFVKERFIGLVHVKDTSSLTLKNVINEIREQGYDGASNMRGEFNGLKALILQENDMEFYVHCFAHQLQLVVVAVTKKHDGVSDFFEQIALVVNVVCASCRRKTYYESKQEKGCKKACVVVNLKPKEG
ncbi:uncharacterized protein LOC111906191 [Lactuca sativa]|uniref:uncharacterized protein LOC111906191 n=1 Tax=Lactuca sativa TaxID=4236 RepID=UPI0022AEF81B|nr:uncharacterized protein LOC111906191 [Lactuca sativa]